MMCLHTLLSLAWAACTVYAIRYTPPWLAWIKEDERLSMGYLPAGPFGVVAALALQYYRLVPPLWTIRVGDMEVTHRALVGAPMVAVRRVTGRTNHQLALAQDYASCVSVLLGMAASRCYSASWGHLGSLSRLSFPACWGAWAQRYLAPLVGSRPLPMRASRAQYYHRRPRSEPPAPRAASRAT